MSSAPKLTAKGSARPNIRAVLPLVWELGRVVGDHLTGRRLLDQVLANEVANG